MTIASRGLTGLGRGGATQGTYGIVRTGQLTKPTVTSYLAQTPPPSDMVRLGTGEYVSKAMFGGLIASEQAYLMKFGVDAFNREQSRVAEQRIEAVAPFKSGEGYDLVKMVGTGYSTERLTEMGFPGEAISEAQKYNSAMTKVQDYELPNNQFDIAKAIEDKVDDDALVLLFGQDVVTQTKQTVAELAPYKTATGYDIVGMVEAGYGEDSLKTLGFNEADIRDAQDYVKESEQLIESTVALSTGELVSKEDWNKLDGNAQTFLKANGVDKFNAEYTTESVTIDTAPAKGWLAETWDTIKLVFTPDEKQLSNAHTTLTTLGINSPGLEKALAQYNQIAYAFVPQVEADIRKDPKGWTIEMGKAVASYLPLVWAVNWNKMSVGEKILNGALDAVILVTLGLGQGLGAVRARPIVNAAKVAGKAADKMTDAVRVLAKTPMDDVVRYGKASANAQRAIQASKVADAKFISVLERVKAISPRQLAVVEKASGIKGLKKAIIEVGKAQTKLNKVWSAVPRDLGTMGGKRYVTAMLRVEKAQANLTKALTTFNTKLQPRFKVTPSPEFQGFATDWHKRVLPYLDEGEPIVSPLGSGKGVQLAVLEKTKPQLKFKTAYDLKLKPVYKTPVVESVKAKAPVVKAGGKLATAGKAAVVTKVAKEAVREISKAERDLYYGSKQAERVVTGHTTVAIGKVIGATKGQPTTAIDWNVDQAVKAITRDAVRVGLDAKVQAMTIEAIREQIRNQIMESVRNLTDADVRTKLAAQTELMTETVTKVVTKLKLKTATKVKTVTKIKPVIPKPRLELKESEAGKRPRYPKGSVVWLMGELKRGQEWKVIVPPYNQLKPISTTKRPVGVKVRKGTPQETLTFIGGKTPFRNVAFDLGVTDGYIDVKHKRIEFTGGGLKTNVGTRIPSTTRGITLANSDMIRRLPRGKARRSKVTRQPSRVVIG